MYTLTFTEEQMHVLNMAIGEIPHKLAAPLIQSINEQIRQARDEATKDANVPLDMGTGGAGAGTLS